MTLDYLRDFIALAETKSYAEAAEQLFISQSSMTRHIQSLESFLGTELFTRTTRKVDLNAYGKAFLPYAYKIIAFFDECISSFTEEMEVVQNTLTIFSNSPLFLYDLMAVIVSFKREYPDCPLAIREVPTMNLKEALLEGKCEFAISREFFDSSPGLSTINYCKDYMVAVLPINHPLAGRDTLSLNELRNDEFLIGRDRFIIERCKKEGFEIKIGYEELDATDRFKLVAEGMGVGLTTLQIAKSINDKNLTFVEVAPRLGTFVNFTYSKERKPSAAGRLFINYLQSYIQARQFLSNNSQ